jgi:hypothetical protein
VLGVISSTIRAVPVTGRYNTGHIPWAYDFALEVDVLNPLKRFFGGL